MLFSSKVGAPFNLGRRELRELVNKSHRMSLRHKIPYQNALDQHQAHAGHTLCVCRRRSSARLAHRERTPSVLLTHVQRTCSACGRAERVSSAPSVRLACSYRVTCTWRAHRVSPWITINAPLPSPLITSTPTLMGDGIGSCWSCPEELPQKMHDPDILRIQYEITVLQHQQNLVGLALHQVDVIRRKTQSMSVWGEPRGWGWRASEWFDSMLANSSMVQDG